MSYYDDDDRYDDDLSDDYDDDYEEDVDEDEQDSKGYSSSRRNVNPYSSNLPGRDRAGSGSSGNPGSRVPPSSGSREDLSSRLNRSTSSTPGSSSSGSGSFYNRPSGSGSGSGSSGSSSSGSGSRFGSGSGSSGSSSSGGSGGGGERKFGTGPLSGSGSGSGSSGSSSSGSGSRFGSGSGSSGSSSSGGSGGSGERKFGTGPLSGSSGSSSSGGSGGSGERKFGTGPLSGSSGSSSSGGSGGSSERKFGTGPLSGSGGSSSSNNPRPFSSGGSSSKTDDKQEEKPSGGLGGRLGGLASGVTSRFGGSKPEEKKDDKAASGSSLGGRLGDLTGGITNRFGGNKPEEKKDDKSTTSSGSRFGGSSGSSTSSSGTTSRFGGTSSGTKADDKPPTNSSLGGRLGGLASGVTSRFGGNKTEEKKDGKQDDKSAGGLGGLASRFRPGGGSTTSTPSSSSTTSSTSASSTSRPGGYGSSSTSSGSSASKPGAATTTGPRFGASATTSRPGDNKAATGKTQNVAATAPSGGFLSNITRRLPFGIAPAEDKKSALSKTSKTRANKVPQTSTEGMSLDTKLDILGVVLVFGALLLVLSAVSPQPGAFTGQINGFFNRMLGWGANAVPLTMSIVGIWLWRRHFGDEPPVIDPLRVLGIIVFYVALLATFQYAESFNPLYKSSFETYSALSPLTIAEGRGGGSVGWTIYNFLVMNATEIGGIVIVLGLFVIAVMLITDTSVAELAAIITSIFRSFQASLHRRAEARAARQLEAQQALPVQPQISVNRPLAAELPAGSAQNALPSPIPAPEPEAVPLPIEERPITIRMGGQTLSGSEQAPAAPPTLPGLTPSVPKPAAKTTTEEQPASGGFAARLKSAVPIAGLTRPKEETPAKPEEKKEESGGLRGLFTRKPAAESGQTETTGTTPVPPPPQPSTSTSTFTTPAKPSPFSRPEVKPAAANAAPEVSEEVSEDFYKPATPKGLGALPKAPSPFSIGAKSNDPIEDEKVEPKPTPVEEEKPAATTTQTMPPAATSTDGGNGTVSRSDRLNELRQGRVGTSPAPAAETTPTTPEPLRPRPFTMTPPAASQPDKPAAESTKPPAVATNAGPPVAEAPKIVLPQAPSPVSMQPRSRRSWNLPDARNLLSPGSEQDFDREALVKRAHTIEETLTSFGAPGRVVEINTGPVITQFGVEPDYLTARGGKKSRVKVSAIAQLDKDLQLALGAKAIRIEAPVPGKGYVGVEVPNDQPATVSLRDVMEAKEFTRIKSPLAIGLGQSVDGTPVSADLSTMPHLLIAGTTGSGKSVCVNSIIASLLLRNTPDRVKFIMVDPKRVELTGYNGIPHLIAPVVVELERIVGVLKWVTREMDERYKKFSNAGARNIEDFNRHLNPGDEIMPYIIVIIDELADLMMLAPEETERTITRIAALARATGIHLVIATQRPSVDVVTGLIKANFPARIAFAVAGSVDSRVILDQPGAERLLGRGDMLYMSGDSPAPLRLQGVFVSDMEINNIVRFWRSQQSEDTAQRPITALTMDEVPAEAARVATSVGRTFGTLQVPTPPSPQQAFWDRDADDDDDDFDDNTDSSSDGEDEMYEEAVELVRRLGKASVSLLQRRLRIGYTRAARLIDLMEEHGIVGPATEGSKPRDVLK